MKKYKIGFTDGVFDMFHVGHLNMIETAKKYCNYLIVGVHSDEIVESYKHRKTIINENDRARIIGSLKAVDKVVINRTRDKVALHDLYKFDVVFIGSDWKGTERWINFEKQLKKVGVDVVYIKYTEGISTTKIREELGETLNTTTSKD